MDQNQYQNPVPNQGFQPYPQQNPFDEGKRKKKKHPFVGGLFTGIAIMLVVFIIAAIVLRYNSITVYSDSFLTDDEAAKLNDLEMILDSYYYKDLDHEDLVDGIYHGLFEGTGDKYTVYYNEEEYEELLIDLEGNYAGIGAVLYVNEDGQIQVEKVYENTPAEAAGIKERDIFLAADDHLASDYTDDLSGFVSWIRGDAGTDVVITYERDGKKNEVTITRQYIVIPSTDYGMLEDNIGYIDIDSFYVGTADEVRAAIEDLTSQGMEGLIFDLRANGGGLVDSVVAILDEILPEGVVVYTVDGNGKREDYTSTNDEYLEVPIVVLVDGNTASASEIFAGAIRDFDYGTLIGTTTYGKGIVQVTLPLTDGTAVKITTETYYTPSGECIHGTGIDPDIEAELDYDLFEDQDYSVDLDNVVNEAISVLKEQIGE